MIFRTKNFIGFLLFVMAFFFFCCTNKSEKSLFSFSVTTDYQFAGLVENDGEELICFVRRHFNPNVKIYNADGIQMDSISLKGAEKILGDITDVWLYSIDSICVFSSFNGTLLIVNNNGVPFFQQSYYNITDDKGFNYDLLPSYPLFPFTSNNIHDIIFSTWMWSGDSEKSPQERLDDVRNGFLMCKINPLEDKGKNVLFGIKYSDIIELSDSSNQSVFFAPLYRTQIVNNRFFMSSFYSRYLYELSEDLSIKNTIKIIDNDALITYPIPFNRSENIQDIANKSMNNCLVTNFVSNVLYDKTNENYVIILKNGKSESLDNYPFKIQLYDKEFQKIKEQDIADFSYLPRQSFILKGNLYIEKVSDTYNTREFEVIKI